MNNKIAVIILTYNRYSEVLRAIKTVINQKSIDYHIFIFDNCSKVSIEKQLSTYKNITYIRHKKNIGFGNNLGFAIRYVKNKGYLYSFLLGDDDMLAYENVLSDMHKLFKDDSNVHVARGGFALFEISPNFITQIFTYKNNDIKKEFESEIERSLNFNISFYSGIMFKNEFVDPNLCKYDDFVTPLILPLLKVLKTKKFNILPEKITILGSSGTDQLATRIYNESTSNTEALQRTLKILKINFTLKPSIFELINYKIYSRDISLIKKYYMYSISNRKFINKVPYFLVMKSPKLILILLKYSIKKMLSFKIYFILKKKHDYIAYL